MELGTEFQICKTESSGDLCLSVNILSSPELYT